MKKKIYKFGYLLLPFIIVGVYLEYNLNKYPDHYSMKKEEIEQKGKDIEVLILGTSHEYSSLNPRFFSQKAYNMAQVAQPLYYDLALLKLYINKLPKLQTVILPLSYFSFWYQCENTEQESLKFWYYQIFGIPNQSIETLEVNSWSRTILYSPKTAINLALNNFEHTPRKFYYRGWSGNDTIVKLNEDGAYQNPHHNLIKDTNVKQGVSYFIAMIEILQKKNINVIVLQSPLSTTYTKTMLKKYVEKNDSIIENIVNKYNLPYYDYSQKHHYTKIDFFDPDHLNFIGAEKFSKVVDSLIRQ